jgi:Cu/Ag efflux pump CusA
LSSTTSARRNHSFPTAFAALALALTAVGILAVLAYSGIMLISHYNHLMREEGRSSREAIAQGSLERLSPILMTASVIGVGLIPLALGAGEPGREIQQPMAVVILGGIVTSTLLNMIVIPAPYLKFGPVMTLKSSFA